jgi:hypothetical protein
VAVRSAGVVRAVIASAALLGGCATLLAVRGQHERADRNAVISGTITTAYEPRGPLVVGLATREGSGFAVVDYFVAEKPGPWMFAVEPGTYWIGAFEDANRDTRYEEEPGLRPDPERPVTLAPGQELHGIALRIPHEGRLPRGRSRPRRPGVAVARRAAARERSRSASLAT